MDKKFEPSFCNMGRRIVSLTQMSASQQSAGKLLLPGSDFVAGASTDFGLEEGTSSCSSNVPRRVAGAERRNYPISMLPCEKVLVTKYYVETRAGRVKRGIKRKERLFSACWW